MATKTDRDFDLQQQNLDLKQEKLQMVDEMNKYKQQALMQQMELNKAKTSALLNDQGTWHEGGPMQFAQAGNDITGLAYSAPYREGGNYIELNKPFQAANPYQTPEAFNYTPRELTPPEEIEVSAQDQAELDNIASRFYDVQKQLSSIKYSGNPKEKELRNEAAQLEYEYKKLAAVARDNYKWSMKGFDKGLLSSFDIESGYRRDVSNYDPAVVLKQFSEAITVLNNSLNRAVPGSANYNLLIRDRERMRNDLIRRRDTAPTKELAFSYQAEIDKLGRPTRDLAAETDIAVKKHKMAGEDKEVIGSAVLLDQIQRGVPAAIAAFNAKNKDFQLVREGNEIVIKQAIVSEKTEGFDLTSEAMSKGVVTEKGWKEKSRFKVGDPNALPAMAYMLYGDNMSNKISAYFSEGKLDAPLSNQQNRNYINVSPDLQEHIRKNPKYFAEGLKKGTLKNMFSIDGKNIKKVELDVENGGYKYTLDDNSVVNSSKGELESSERFGLSKEALDILYSNKDGNTVPSMIITYANGKKVKIPIFKKHKFVGSKGSRNTVNPLNWIDIEN